MIGTRSAGRDLARGLICAFVLAAVACSESPSAPAGPPAELTALPRTLTAAEQSVLDAANAFSFALWGKITAAQPGENVFVSPLSASFALGMTLNGASGQTFDEMRNALQVPTMSQHDINDGYRSLIALLSSLDATVAFQIANSIWYRQDFTFLQSFFDTTRTYFAAKVAPLDFANASASLATINAWVSASTNGKIPTILDAIRDTDVMFLINAIYFKGSWRDAFDPIDTRDAPFHAAGGQAQTVKTMHRRGEFAYAESPAWQAVDLPYGNAAFRMTIVLPKPGTDVESVAASLTPASWASMTAAMTPREEVDLTLPRLKLEYERTLNDDLKALGMHVPFIGEVADFTRMSTAGNQLYITFVKQKTFVDVNEEGTEAAAATVVGVGVTSAPVTTDVHVDRPFIFVIRERLSGTVLFMGKITSIPTS